MPVVSGKVCFDPSRNLVIVHDNDDDDDDRDDEDASRRPSSMQIQTQKHSTHLAFSQLAQQPRILLLKLATKSLITLDQPLQLGELGDVRKGLGGIALLTLEVMSLGFEVGEDVEARCGCGRVRAGVGWRHGVGFVRWFSEFGWVVSAACGGGKESTRCGCREVVVVVVLLSFEFE